MSYSLYCRLQEKNFGKVASFKKICHWPHRKGQLWKRSNEEGIEKPWIMYYVTNKDIKLRQRPPQFISLVCILCVESVWDRTFFFKLIKYKRFKKLRSLHLHWKFKLFAGKFTWGDKAKHCLVMSTDFLFSKVCWQCRTMFCLYKSSKPIIWIFTEGESDGIESRNLLKYFLL